MWINWARGTGRARAVLAGRLALSSIHTIRVHRMPRLMTDAVKCDWFRIVIEGADNLTSVRLDIVVKVRNGVVSTNADDRGSPAGKMTGLFLVHAQLLMAFNTVSPQYNGYSSLDRSFTTTRITLTFILSIIYPQSSGFMVKNAKSSREGCDARIWQAAKEKSGAHPVEALNRQVPLSRNENHGQCIALC